MTSSPQRLRALIVDDELIDRLQVSRAIEKAGLDCLLDEALTLNKARERLVIQEFDVIFLDNHLPDGYGATFAREIRDTGLARDARIVMLTGEPSVARALVDDTCPWQDILDKDDFSFRRLREILLRSTETPVAGSDQCMQMFCDLADRDLPTALDTLENMNNAVWDRIDAAPPTKPIET